MKVLLTLLMWVILPLSVLWKAVVTGGVGYLFYRKRRLRDSSRITTPGGVDSLDRVVLGGIRQWILVRGEDRLKPVLLFLHGGPGVPEGPLVRHYNRRLEEAFVVVHWDQRGAGKSFSMGIPKESMRLEQFVTDTCELARLLGERFGQDRVFLVGHSWGSAVGILAAQRCPQFFHAFAGVGQAVDFARGGEVAYRHAVQAAREQGLTRWARRLERIGPPPYRGLAGIWRARQLRSMLFRSGGVAYGETDEARYLWKLLKLYLLAPDYSLVDLGRLVWGTVFSMRLLGADLHELDLVRRVPRLDLPVYFLAGRHDRVTPSELVEEYHGALAAPRKSLIWFERSAHSPHLEEPDRFAEILVSIALGQADGGS
ncbi:MAG: alpha/beta hydrolase [bacterium]|nr:alpha/beta hydrolase [bacterium]